MTLPHLPIWNLIPRRNQAASWKCTWHGWIEGPKCAECHREHAEYLETGTWTPKESPRKPERRPRAERHPGDPDKPAEQE